MTNLQNNKVLFVLKVPPPYGGGEIEHLYIYNALKENYNFLLFSRKSHTKAKQGKVLLANVWHGLVMIVRIFWTCARLRPALVFTWLPKDLPGFMRTAFWVSFLRLFRIKIIGDLHGMSFDFYRRRLWRGFYRRNINKFYALRVLSPRIGEHIQDTGYRHRVAPIDNGVLAPRFPQDNQPTFEPPLRLLYLGAISEAKGFLRVLELANDLTRAQVRFSINVVGEWVNTQLRQQAMDFITQNRLESSIHFLGVKLDEDKWRIIGNSHLLLHFSAWDGQPLTIIEAMAAGVPAVAMPVGAIPEMIEHNVNGFLIDRVDQAVQIIVEMLAQRLDYAAISSSAQETYERRFTVEKYIEHINELVNIDNAAGDSVPKNG